MDYKLLFDTAVYAGEILMKSGAETYRVEDTMYRILKKSELKTVEVLVMMTGFVVTLDDPSIDCFTCARRINSRSTNLEMIDTVNTISRAFCNDEITLEEAFAKIKRLWEKPKERKISVPSMSLLVAGFAIMFGGTLFEAFISGFTGILASIAIKKCTKWQMHPFVENVICSVIVALFVGVAGYISPVKCNTDLLIVSGIMPFVPGAAITNAVFDIIHGDYLSGLARAADAFIVALAVAIGIGIGLFLV